MKIVNGLLFSKKKKFIINVWLSSEYGFQIILYEKLKTLWSFSMDGVQMFQGYRANTRRQFTTQSPGIPGTHLINL